MTLNLLARRQFTSECKHENQRRIEIAGMSRTVCQSCGRVSIGYLEHHYDSDSTVTLSDG